ncbi:low molecular weight protein-tyrosine-phosphatase [Melghirimyces algeriensis]|uniref:protein-tyrosine-phosphatase n=1 Tax=Melghirimyces algeriensis TaxID=910412 RepID=A0A521ASY4_9BACL|nr:low molecular weight protein-tyrosine-phosphatase [Melghirimyces algeriensis]SMO37919.1 protein-tyrosine phosphatase [Melghirimyces algeriensis]
MVSVLFVCLGNICRSPMAEAVFRHQLQEHGLLDRVRVDSAGTGDWHIGEFPHQGTRTILSKYAISDEGIQARQIKADDLKHFDYVIVMDQQNYRDVKQLAGNSDSNIYQFVRFIPETDYHEVPDPYFTGDFEETYRLVKAGCQGIIQTLREKENL